MTTYLTRLGPQQADYAERLAALASRSADSDPEVEATVRGIVSDVRQRGDAAVRELTERFDGRAPHQDASYELPRDWWDDAAKRVTPRVRQALERAAERIRSFHRPQVPRGYAIDGGALALRPVPLQRVGLYVPGGTARYPSSVLMTAIPARVAGVGEIVMVTPGASDETLAAAAIAGVDRVFEIGGAQAVAALAYGTESVPRVDKIVGPGNQWVAAAKRLVYGQVDIDSIAGPSEVLIIADDSADPTLVAADLLAQAEHDVEARAILVTTSSPLVDAVDAEIERHLEHLSRADIAAESIRRHGVAILVPDLAAAIAIANDYAPEHLELACADAATLADEVHGAGAIFVGHHTPEAAGDYLAGPNHVLPTGGAARYASPLGVYDFVKHVSVLHWSREMLRAHAADIAALAEVEGLTAHARSVTLRTEGEE